MTGKIKMLGLDLDGTVLNNKKQMSEKTKEAIRRAIEAGVLVLPATGRPLRGIPEEFLQMEGIRYALSANGAVIYDLAENIKIYEDCMDCTQAIEIIEKLQKMDILADAFVDGIGYVEAESMERGIQFAPTPEVREYMQKTRACVKDLPAFLRDRNENVQKMTINFRKMEDGTLFGKEEALRILKQYKGLAVVSGMETNLEITKETATKGNGLLHLGQLVGISKDEIMACGDSGNDKEMLKAVGLGVAMANAEEEVLRIADYITRSNEEDGVAFAIEHFILNGEE